MKRFSIFTHPNENCMSYTDHALLSSGLGIKLFIAGAKAMIHAFCPWIFKTSTSDCIGDITKILTERGCKKNSKFKVVQD